MALTACSSLAQVTLEQIDNALEKDLLLEQIDTDYDLTLVPTDKYLITEYLSEEELSILVAPQPTRKDYVRQLYIQGTIPQRVYGTSGGLPYLFR